MHIATTIFTLFILLTTTLNAQEIATFKIFESQLFESKITIIYETGKSDIISLKNISILSNLPKEEILKSQIDNQKTITKELNQMKEKGYSISQMSMSGESHITTLILFTKKED
jgi:hypothetical protein